MVINFVTPTATMCVIQHCLETNNLKATHRNPLYMLHFHHINFLKVFFLAAAVVAVVVSCYFFQR